MNDFQNSYGKPRMNPGAFTTESIIKTEDAKLNPKSRSKNKIGYEPLSTQIRSDIYDKIDSWHRLQGVSITSIIEDALLKSIELYEQTNGQIQILPRNKKNKS